MNERRLTTAVIEAYDRRLKEDERASATREKYLRSIRAFAAWLGDGSVTKDAVTEWKAHLVEQRQAPSTINTALAALNGLFRFLGWEDCRARFLKVQRRIFRAPERELTRAEYDRLLAAAESTGDARLALLMESICATGIRVSEVKYLGDDTPLFEYFFIVSSKTVDALDDKGVAVFQLAQQPPVAAPCKVLTGLFVQRDLAVLQPELPQSDELPLLVLLSGGHSCITVIHVLTSQFIGV